MFQTSSPKTSAAISVNSLRSATQRGIAIIQNQLHICGFTEVNTGRRPQLTGRPGEYISVLIRRLGVHT
ncbi:hypothetical protein HC928_20180 [bacterium]|nr:hypothetical protein [bacterium]